MKLDYLKIIGLVLIVFSIISFITTFYLAEEVKGVYRLLHQGQSCPIAPEVCPMFRTPTAAVVSYTFSGLLFLIGLYLVFSKKQITEKTGKNIKKVLNNLDKDEKKILQIVSGSQGTIFQSELAEKSGFDKVKVTRILDRLEGKQIIERRRRGMTNVVIMK